MEISTGELSAEARVAELQRLAGWLQGRESLAEVTSTAYDSIEVKGDRLLLDAILAHWEEAGMRVFVRGRDGEWREPAGPAPQAFSWRRPTFGPREVFFLASGAAQTPLPMLAGFISGGSDSAGKAYLVAFMVCFGLGLAVQTLLPAMRQAGKYVFVAPLAWWCYRVLVDFRLSELEQIWRSAVVFDSRTKDSLIAILLTLPTAGAISYSLAGWLVEWFHRRKERADECR